MRCFTVNGEGASEGIYISCTPYPHIPVGREGRGRKLERFPVASRFADRLAEGKEIKEGDVLLVERASVLKTKERGTLLLVEERNHDDRRALALVGIRGGYRGSTKWTAVDKEETPCPERGNRLFLSYCSDCNESGVIDQDGYTVHPDKGVVVKYAPFPSAGITILAEGYGAEGAAGYAGGPHWVRLIIMEPGACFRVVRRGRLYGGPSELYVYWDGERMRVGTHDEIFPPSCETPEGELI